MLSHLFQTVTSLVAGAGLLLGGLVPLTQAPEPPVGEGAALAQPAPGLPERLRDLNPIRRLFAGDRLVRQGLTHSLASVAGLTPTQIAQGLLDEQSIQDLAEAEGQDAGAILAVYDEYIEFIFTQAVEKARLPQSLADGRIAWYQSAARLVIDQPGLTPSYPALHALHAGLIAAAIRTGDLDRAEVKAGLQACQSLDQILVEAGHTGQEAVDSALGWIEKALDKFESNGQLSPELHAAWSEALAAGLAEMVAMPGLHFAGKECAP